jgi:hypothetical protein
VAVNCWKRGHGKARDNTRLDQQPAGVFEKTRSNRLSRFNTSRVCVVCILASFISTPAQAFGFNAGNSKQSPKDNRVTTNRPWGNIEGSRPAQQYQAPPPPPNNYYLGSAPATGWYTAPPSAGNTTTSDPVVEVDIAGSVFYEQQNIVYTVRVVSDGNLKSLTPELPRIKGAVLEQLNGPVATTRRSGNKQQIVNTYLYRLMPLRSGEIIIPAISFAGTHADSSPLNRAPGMPAATPAGSFNIAAEAPRTLQVRPAEPAIIPWLPLHDLKLYTDLQQKKPVKAGEPVTLAVELKAEGALGNQLPSLARHLESKHYRIYRDTTTTTDGLSSNGRYLTGTRKETYTIIPLVDGWIRLPEVALAWWDVDSATARHAGVPFSRGDTAASGRLNAGQAAEEHSVSPVYFWAPMIIVFSLIAGFWLGAWPRTRSLLQSATAWLSVRGQHALQRAQTIGTTLAPASHLRRAQMGLAVLMPTSIKLWMCSRCLHAEDDPQAWCTQFKSRVCQHLGISTQAPLSVVTEKIIAASPQAEPGRLRALANSLDGAIYGGNSLDFPVWKQELVQQLHPRLLFWRKSKTRRTKNSLPALNPHIV